MASRPTSVTPRPASRHSQNSTPIPFLRPGSPIPRFDSFSTLSTECFTKVFEGISESFCLPPDLQMLKNASPHVNTRTFSDLFKKFVLFAQKTSPKMFQGTVPSPSINFSSLIEQKFAEQFCSFFYLSQEMKKAEENLYKPSLSVLRELWILGYIPLEFDPFKAESYLFSIVCYSLFSKRENLADFLIKNLSFSLKQVLLQKIENHLQTPVENEVFPNSSLLSTLKEKIISIHGAL